MPPELTGIPRRIKRGVAFLSYRNRKASGLSNIKILVALPDGQAGIRFEEVAANGAVGAAEVAWFPGFVQRAEGVGNVLGELLGQNGDGIGLEACTGRV